MIIVKNRHSIREIHSVFLEVCGSFSRVPFGFHSSIVCTYVHIIKPLATLKVGDKVPLTCQDTEEGKHEGINKIMTTEEKKT